MNPTPRRYLCRRMREPARFDGSLGDPAWASLPWTKEFVDITGAAEKRPVLATRAKLGWNEASLYVGAWLEEPHVWGSIRERNAVIFHDNDFELFLDPDGDGRNYYELEVNALGTIWELILPKAYREGGRPRSGKLVEGLRWAVHVDGTLNDPRDVDRGWSVEIALPWSGLAPFNRGRSTPPEPGDVWRANFSRVQWRHEIVDGSYRRLPPHGTPLPAGDPETTAHPEENWVWSPQGVVNMHRPDRWGEIVFVDHED